MVDLHAAFGEQFLHIAVRQRKAQVPAHGEDDHVGREAEASESRPGNGWRARTAGSHGDSLPAPGSLAADATAPHALGPGGVAVDPVVVPGGHRGPSHSAGGAAVHCRAWERADRGGGGLPRVHQGPWCRVVGCDGRVGARLLGTRGSAACQLCLAALRPNENVTGFRPGGCARPSCSPPMCARLRSPVDSAFRPWPSSVWRARFTQGGTEALRSRGPVHAARAGSLPVTTRGFRATAQTQGRQLDEYYLASNTHALKTRHVDGMPPPRPWRIHIGDQQRRKEPSKDQRSGFHRRECAPGMSRSVSPRHPLGDSRPPRPARSRTAPRRGSPETAGTRWGYPRPGIQ